MSIAITGCGPGPIQIDVLEEVAARVVELPSDEARTVPRAELPPEAREGDVIVDGRVNARMTEEYRRRVAELRMRLMKPLTGHLDL